MMKKSDIKNILTAGMGAVVGTVSGGSVVKGLVVVTAIDTGVGHLQDTNR